MTSEGKNTLKNGNIPRGRRDEVNKYRKEMLKIGEENSISLYQWYLELARNDPDKETRRKCHEFLLDKIIPKVAPELPGRYVKIPLSPMNTLEDVKENEMLIMQHVCDSSISLEEGKELYAMIKQNRETYAAIEITSQILEIKQQMKDQGIK